MPAGQSAPLAPLRFSGRCGVSPHVGVDGDSAAAPDQGKTFPAEKCFLFARNDNSRGRRVDANDRITSKQRLRRCCMSLFFLEKLERVKGLS